MLLKILRNSIFLLSGHVIAKVFSLISLIILARQLGVEGFGFYGRVMAYLTLFATIADAGMGTVTIRDVAQDRSRSHRYFTQIFLLRMLLTMIGYVCLVALGGFRQDQHYPLTFVVVCGLFLFPEAVRKLGISLLTAYEHIHFVAVVEVLSIFLRYLPFFTAIILGQSLRTAFGLLVITWGMIAVFSLVLSQRACLLHWVRSPVNFSEFRHILHEAYPFGILTLLSVIYFKIDILMLAEMQGDIAVGFYEGAYKFVEAPFFIPVSIVNVLLPVMARTFTTDQASYKNTYIHATRILAMGILPVVLLVSLLSRDVILLVLNESYLPSAPALSVVIWALFWMFVNAPVGNIIATSHSMHAFLPYAIGSVVFNIIMNAILIPRYSFFGACIATLLTEVLSFSFQLTFAQRILGSARQVLVLVGKILAAGGVAAALFYATEVWLPTLAGGLLVVGTYVVCVFLFRLVDANDRVLCRELFTLARAKLFAKSHYTESAR